MCSVGIATESKSSPKSKSHTVSAMACDGLNICRPRDRRDVGSFVERRFGFGQIRREPSGNLVVMDEHPPPPLARAKPAPPNLLIEARGRASDQCGRAGDAVI